MKFTAIIDATDIRVAREYALWYALTAVPWIPSTQRYCAAQEYFTRIGIDPLACLEASRCDN